MNNLRSAGARILQARPSYSREGQEPFCLLSLSVGTLPFPTEARGLAVMFGLLSGTFQPMAGPPVEQRFNFSSRKPPFPSLRILLL